MTAVDQRSTGDGLDVLLVEDNPGDARLIEEMVRDTAELSRRIDPDSSESVTPTVHREGRLEDGLAFAETNPVDVVLLDLNLPDSAGLESLEQVEAADATDDVPVVVLTGVSDQRTGVEAIDRGAQDYLVKDEVTSQLLVRSIHHAIERKEQELERERRREQLESLNRLNRIGQDITHAVITTETREELEQAVCDRLTADDAYRFAWIGSVARGGSEVLPRVHAGVEEGYLEEITITVDDGETAEGPSGTAVQDQEVSVTHDVAEDASFEPWRSAAQERGYRSTAAIPISHDELRYGVLNVYAGEAGAFDGPEREILGRLGDVIGHAIAALERKAALVSDDVLELEFTVAGFADPLAELTATGGGAVTFERLVRRDEGMLVYGSAESVPRDDFDGAVDRLSFTEDHRLFGPGGETFDFELETDGSIPLLETVATHGGRIRSIRVADGDVRVVVELPQRGNTGAVIETVEDAFDEASYVAQRTVDRRADRIPDRSTLEAELTEKQRDALKTAYFAGYFDWPRESTGEEVAGRLGISPATFTQHLRAAEGKFFDAVFDDVDGD